jgi:hypothetical protein
LPSLFEARRRLPTSATAFTTCGQPNPGSFNPRRDGDLDLLPFLRRATPLPCGSGDTRRAALRSPVSAPVLVPLGCPSLPSRDAESNAPPPKLAPRSIVGINVHGSKDRAKDASPGACDDVSCLRRVRAHRSRMQTAFPSSASSGHPLSSARRLPREDTHGRRRTDRGPRSDDTPRRVPPSRKPGCLSPPRHAKESFDRGGIAPSGLRAGSLAHAAHTCSRFGDRAFDWALQGHGAVTRGSVTGSRVQTPV